MMQKRQDFFTCSTLRHNKDQCSGHYIRAVVLEEYVGLEELTPYAPHEPVKAIYIDEPNKGDGRRRQSIHISYDFVGFIPIQEMMQEEMA